MTFDDMWKSLEERDTTGKYKQAREMAELNVEQLEFAYNSGYADAKSKYERPQGELAEKLKDRIEENICKRCPMNNNCVLCEISRVFQIITLTAKEQKGGADNG